MPCEFEASEYSNAIDDYSDSVDDYNEALLDYILETALHAAGTGLLIAAAVGSLGVGVGPTLIGLGILGLTLANSRRKLDNAEQDFNISQDMKIQAYLVFHECVQENTP